MCCVTHLVPEHVVLLQTLYSLSVSILTSPFLLGMNRYCSNIFFLACPFFFRLLERMGRETLSTVLRLRSPFFCGEESSTYSIYALVHLSIANMPRYVCTCAFASILYCRPAQFCSCIDMATATEVVKQAL